MSRRYFDLNIQRVLEHWTVSEALRELIARCAQQIQEQNGTRLARGLVGCGERGTLNAAARERKALRQSFYEGQGSKAKKQRDES